MTRTLFAVLLAACTGSPAEGIPGDTSPDDGTPPDESAGGKADGAGGPIVAGKGVLIDAPTIAHVYWGSYWNTDDGATARLVLDPLPAAVAQSTWWHVLDQYTAHDKLAAPPAVDTPVVIDSSEPPPSIKEGALHTFLANQFHAGTLAWTAETIFVVITAPGSKPPADECGHHSYFSTTIDGARRKVIYAFVPSFTDDGCAGNATVNGGGLDSATVTLSHEYAEAATDPYLDAWGEGGDHEVADPCDDGFALATGDGPYAIQKLWSNAANGCVEH